MQVIANTYKAKEIIRFIREDTGLSQTNFGKKLNRSRNAIQNYEYGQRKYDFEFLLEIAKQFGLEIIIRSKKK